MMFTLEHALILILALAVIYYVIQHRNLLTDLLIIPDRDHPELKAVKGKHDYDKVENNNNEDFRLNIGRDPCKIQTGEYDGRYACLTDNKPVIYCGPYMNCDAPPSTSLGHCVSDKDKLNKYFQRHPESVGMQSCLLRR